MPRAFDNGAINPDYDPLISKLNWDLGRQDLGEIIADLVEGFLEAILHEIKRLTGIDLETVGEFLAGILGRITGGVYEALDALGFLELLADWGEAIGGFVKLVSDACAQLFGMPFSEGFTSIGIGENDIAKFINGIQEFIGSVAGFFGIDANTPQAILEFLQGIVDGAWGLINGVFGEIGHTVAEVWEAVFEFLSPLAGVINTVFVETFKGIVEFFGNVGEGFMGVFENVINFFTEVVDLDGFLGAIGELITPLVGFVNTIFVDTFKGVIEFFSAVGEGFMGVFENVINFFTEVVDLDGFLNAIGSFFEPLVGVIDSLFVDTFKGIVDFFGAVGEGFMDVFESVIGFFSGVTDLGGFLDAIGNLFEPLVGVIDSLFADTLKWVVDFFAAVGQGFTEVLETIVGFFSGITGIGSIGSGLLDWIDEGLIKPVLGVLTGGIPDLSALGAWARSLLTQGSRVPAENLFGQVSTSLFGIIPVSHISNEKPNLLSQGMFDTSDMVEPGDGWEWDGSTAYTGTGGSLKLTANGAVKQMFANQSIPVSAGDKVALTAWIKTANLAASGSPIILSLIPFSGQIQGTAVTIATSAASTTWKQLFGDVYQVPSGVTSLRVRLGVTQAATSGTIWWDDVRLAKTGLLQQGLVERLIDGWNNLWHGLLGFFLPDRSVDDLFVAASGIREDTNQISIDLADFIGKVLAFPGDVIGNIAKVVIDGVNTIGSWLGNLWGALTGNPPKSEDDARADDVTTALTSVRDQADLGVLDAAEADGKADVTQSVLQTVQLSGSNLLSNYGFENTNFAHADYLSTEQAYGGSHSLKITVPGLLYVNPFQPSLTSYVVPFAAAANDSFYFEGWIFPHSGNSTVPNGQTLNMYLRCENTSGTQITTTGKWIDTRPLVKGQWNKFSGTLTIDDVPAVVQARLTMNFRVEETDNIYYFDNVALYRTTEANAAQTSVQTAVDGIAQSTQGGSSTGNAPATVKSNMSFAWSKFYDGLNDSTGSANILPSQVETVARVTRQRAELGVENAAEADGKAQAAQQAADRADQLLRAAITSGSNLVTDPSFEDSSLDSRRAGRLSGNWNYVTDINRSGSRAVENTFPGGTSYPGMYLTPTFGGTFPTDFIPVRDGQTFYISQWVYMRSPNAGNRTVALFLVTYNAAGVPEYPFVSAAAPLDQWYQNSGYITINRPDVAYMRPIFGAVRPGNDADTRTVFDDVVLIEVTDAYNAAQSAANAKRVIDLRSNDFTNLAAGSDFEGEHPWIVTQGTTGWSVATDQKRSGSKSLKLIPHTGYHVLELDVPIQAKHDAVSGGDRFFAEVWAYRDAAYGPGDADVKLRFGNQNNDYISQIGLRSGDISSANAWTRRTVSFEVPAGTTGLKVTLPANTTTGNLWIDDIVIRRMVSSDGIQNSAVTGSKIALAAVDSSKVAELDGSKLVTGTVDATRIGDLPGEKITTGFVAEGRVQNLLTTKNTANAARTIAVSTAASGANMVPDPGFELSDGLWQSAKIVGTSVTLPYDGNRCCRLVAGENGSPPLYSIYHLNRTESASYRFNVKEDDVYYGEYWVKGAPGNTLNGGGLGRLELAPKRADGSPTGYLRISFTPSTTAYTDWTKVSGYFTVPKGSVEADLYLYFNVNSEADRGETYFFDNVIVRQVSTSELIGNLAVTNAKIDTNAVDSSKVAELDGSRINSGTVPENRVQNLAAIKSLAGSSNLATNPGFESTDFLLGSNSVISTEMPRNGARSLRVHSTAGAYRNSSVTSSNTSSTIYLPCMGGDRYYMEAWVRAASANTSSTGAVYTQFIVRRGSPGSFTLGYYNAAYMSNPLDLKNTWTRLSGYVTMPEDAFEFTAICALGNNFPASNQVFYFDDVVLRRVPRQGEIDGLPAVPVETTLEQHADEITKLKGERDATATQGKHISVTFSGLKNDSELPKTTGNQRWSTRYSGSGAGTWGIVNGRASWTGSTSGSRSATVVYLGDGTAGSETTLTDYQVLRGVLVNPPIGQEFTAMARVTTSGNSFATDLNPDYYVWATAVATIGGFLSVSVTGSIGCVVNGASHTWVDGIPLTWSTEMTLKCGVDGDLRRYQVFSGTELVLDYREDDRKIEAGDGTIRATPSTPLSSIGSTFRRWGAIARYSGLSNSGTVSSVSVSDDPPVVYAGSVARMARLSTGTATLASGTRALPSNFFDDDVFESRDITSNPSTGTFTVSKSGMYLITGRIRLSSFFASITRIDLQVNNSTTQHGETIWPFDSFHNAQGTEYALTGTWLQYLYAGQSVRLVTYRKTGSSSVLRGGAGETYFSISGLGTLT
jgi:hypothetical protein